MLIAHISDFHIFANQPETHLVRLDAEKAARKVVADVAAQSPSVDAVMFTGDLTDGGSAADYALLRDVLAPISVPIFVVPGNHDKRSALRAAFGDRLTFTDETFLHYDTTFKGIRILALDTFVEGRVEGRLCPIRMRWIRERLSRPVGGPLFIAMHHPPFKTGITALDDMALVEGGPELGQLVAAQAGGARILCGHIHRPIQAVWNGAFAAIAGSPAFQQGLDLTPHAAEPGPVNEPYAYFIHHLAADGTFAVHARYVPI